MQGLEASPIPAVIGHRQAPGENGCIVSVVLQELIVMTDGEWSSIVSEVDTPNESVSYQAVTHTIHSFAFYRFILLK